MPRSKIGKKRNSVNETALTSAAKQILSETMSYREADRTYLVSKTTIMRNINRIKISGNETLLYNLPWLTENDIKTIGILISRLGKSG